MFSDKSWISQTRAFPKSGASGKWQSGVSASGRSTFKLRALAPAAWRYSAKDRLWSRTTKQGFRFLDGPQWEVASSLLLGTK